MNIKLALKYILYLLFFKLRTFYIIKHQTYTLFFCGNSSIGDNVVLMSLIEPFYKSRKVDRLYYLGKKQYVNQLKFFYQGLHETIIWKCINNALFDYVLSDRAILTKIILYFNRHKENAFHSLFFVEEKIPANMNIIQYQKAKMGINESYLPCLPSLKPRIKKPQIVINIESQTIIARNIIKIMNVVVGYCNTKNIVVLFNSTKPVLKGSYKMIYPTLDKFVEIVQESLAFISVRTGLMDLVMGLQTNMMAIYSGYNYRDFSLFMYEKRDKKIVEIKEEDFDISILDYLIDMK